MDDLHSDLTHNPSLVSPSTGNYRPRSAALRGAGMAGVDMGYYQSSGVGGSKKIRY